MKKITIIETLCYMKDTKTSIISDRHCNDLSKFTVMENNLETNTCKLCILKMLLKILLKTVLQQTALKLNTKQRQNIYIIKYLYT